MDETLSRLAAVARSEGGEELLKRILDAIAPAQSISSAVPATPMDISVSSQQPLPSSTPTNLLQALSAVERPHKPSKGRSRKDLYAQDLLSAAGAGAGYPEAPPAKRAKKPRRPYSPDVRGASSKNTAPTGSGRSSKGGSGRSQVTSGRHLAANLRSVCAPAPSSSPSSRMSASASSSGPAPSPQQHIPPSFPPASSAGTPVIISSAPPTWSPPVLSPPADGSSTSSGTSPPPCTSASMTNPENLAQLHTLGGLIGSAVGAACQSGAPPSTSRQDQVYPTVAEARSAGSGNQDGRLPATTGEAVAGHRDPSSSDEESSPTRHAAPHIQGVGAIGGRRRNALPGALMDLDWDLITASVRKSLSAKTWADYSAAWQDWCSYVGLFQKSPFADEVELVLSYVCSKVSLGASIPSLQRKLCGISFFRKLHQSPSCTDYCLVRQMMKGFRSGLSVPDGRRPISFELLGDLLLILPLICSSEYEVRLFRAAFSLAFFGALRISELVAKAKSEHSGLRPQDVSWSSTAVQIFIKKSKTDRAGRGAWLTLFKLDGSSSCPVRLVSEFSSIRSSSPSFLSHADGSALSIFQFRAILGKCMNTLGLQAFKFSSHSFRIGAATEAARLGLSESIIKKIGRWESHRYRLYVRPSLVV
ncbi:streptococcal hemagglutinin-like isoform X1 [Hyperolius riggenbachi]|uniref:streptococcal hemagglutinin-like isoform X1 n=1 Tax=Hyperolius riggenbachi TaxID=752182 RepID=UPI0035A3102A